MTSPYWKVMNDVSETITSFLTVRDILRDYSDSPKMVEAALTLLDHYIEVQDEAFIKAWNEVVKKPQTKYTDDELDAMCDAAELEQTKKNYRAAIDEYNGLHMKHEDLVTEYDRLLLDYEQLQDLFYKVDSEHDELKVKYDQCQDNYHTVVKSLTKRDTFCSF